MPIREAEIRAAALAELADTPNGTLSTSDLIERLTVRMKPIGHDAEIAINRDDTYFSQKVRNIVSHREAGTGLQKRGLADFDPGTESWTISQLGVDHLGS